MMQRWSLGWCLCLLGGGMIGACAAPVDDGFLEAVAGKGEEPDANAQPSEAFASQIRTCATNATRWMNNPIDTTGGSVEEVVQVYVSGLDDVLGSCMEKAMDPVIARMGARGRELNETCVAEPANAEPVRDEPATCAEGLGDVDGYLKAHYENIAPGFCGAVGPMSAAINGWELNSLENSLFMLGCVIRSQFAFAETVANHIRWMDADGAGDEPESPLRVSELFPVSSDVPELTEEQVSQLDPTVLSFLDAFITAAGEEGHKFAASAKGACSLLLALAGEEASEANVDACMAPTTAHIELVTNEHKAKQAAHTFIPSWALAAAAAPEREGEAAAAAP